MRAPISYVRRMRKFPNVLSGVNPLYCASSAYLKDQTSRRFLKSTPNSVAPQEPINSTRHNNTSKPKFNYHSRVKIVNTNMYEPVSDSCVTIINSKYGNKRTYDQSDVEEDCSSAVYPENCDTNNEQETRRTKVKKQAQLGCNLLNRRNCDNMRTGNVDNYIDVDHITLETERNYKNRFCSVAVQTSPFLPYRLRFWPKCNSDIKCDPSGNSSFNDKLKCCGRTLSQWFFSQIGLSLILINWALLGAAAFYKTEGPRELEQSDKLESLQKELAIDLATALRQVSEYSQLWPDTIRKYMSKHETLLLDAVSAGYGEGGGGCIWTYPGCILFAVSLLTTLGFGAPVPRTSLGRGTAVLFSAIGIPLHFLLILNVGHLAAGKLQLLFKNEAQPTSPIHNETTTVTTASKPSRALKWFPFFAIVFYYALGAILFGFVRQRDVIDSLMFPLDFTATGGVAKTSGHVRILYALYLEAAVMLAATIVSLLQASATRGIVDIGLKLGLLTNT